MLDGRYTLVSDLEKSHYWDTEKNKSVCGTRIDDPIVGPASVTNCKRCRKWLIKQKKAREKE